MWFKISASTIRWNCLKFLFVCILLFCNIEKSNSRNLCASFDYKNYRENYSELNIRSNVEDVINGTKLKQQNSNITIKCNFKLCKINIPLNVSYLSKISYKTKNEISICYEKFERCNKDCIARADLFKIDIIWDTGGLSIYYAKAGINSELQRDFPNIFNFGYLVSKYGNEFSEFQIETGKKDAYYFIFREVEAGIK
jgi:hypothetical protein